MLTLFFYLVITILIVCEAYFIIKIIEYTYCVYIKYQIPLATSTTRLRRAIIQEIKTNYKDAKTIVEIGSGFGGLSRLIAKNTNATVYSLENMPFTIMLAKFFDAIFHSKNKTIWCDAYKYLAETDQRFDIAVAYMGPYEIQELAKYKNKIGILISMDFELENVQPIKVIDVGHGHTTYNRKKYPHKVFIYKF